MDVTASFFHAAGLRIAGHENALPEPLGRAAQPAPLDAGRLRVLARMVTRWRTPGVWQTLRALLLDASYATVEARVSALQRVFEQFGLSQARSDILICNVVLPFAQALYMQHPGLSSNRVTRMMCAQLGLAREPVGSCAQQGLHYIYQQTCREKQCEVCIVGRRF
ncbi:MAG TPA: hypothetical protein VHZ51_08105 [Ktedonobacteraceae bacterium]|jgi:hypothetical protein|nr:hypothetical protein [Ktedonobacteraceae bacterium]